MYHFFAVVEIDHERSLRRIPLEGGLQRELSAEFDRQRADLLPKDAEIIPYEPGYKPDDEVFVLESYLLPPYIGEALRAPDALPGLHDDDLEEGRVKSIFAVQISNPHPRLIVFQNFNAGQVVRRGGGFIFLDGKTFQRSDRTGLRIDDKSTAVFENGNLYFQSEHMVRRYLDLDAFFKAATDEEIAQLLEDPSFAPANAAVVSELADRWSRRKVTSIRMRGILGKVSVPDIVKVGREFKVNVITATVDGQMRIVFPEDDKKAMKALLRFLDDDLLRSPLTENRYQVSSKRKL
jgi:hypothetical protein